MTIRALLCLVLLQMAQASVAQPANERDAAALVNEYVSGKAVAARKAAIESRLVRTKPAQLTKPIKDALANAKQRGAALELACLLWTPDVFKSAQKLTESDACPLVVKLGLTRQDKGAPEYLYERWRKSAMDSKEFEFIHAGFKQYYVDIALLDKFKALMESAETDDARKKACAEVVGFQLNLQTVEPQEILDGWNGTREIREQDGKRQAFDGRDLTLISTFKEYKTARRGGNYLLSTEGGMSSISWPDAKALPAELQVGDWSINFRVYIKSKVINARFSISAKTKGGDAYGGSVYNNGMTWHFLDAKGKVAGSVPYKPGAWTTVSFEIADRSTPKEKFRYVNRLIDGKILQDGSMLDGEICELIAIVEEGELLISGVELVPK